MVLSAPRGLVGIVVATAWSYGLSGVMDVPYSFDKWISLLTLLFAAFIDVVFGYFPACSARAWTRQKPCGTNECWGWSLGSLAHRRATSGSRKVPSMKIASMTPVPPRRPNQGGARSTPTRRPVLSLLLALSVAAGLVSSPPASASTPIAEDIDGNQAVPLAAAFQLDVTPRLALPRAEIVAYGVRLQSALDEAQRLLSTPQFVLLVDRSPNVQAMLVYWGSAERGWGFVGAAPVSTGLPGRYEHFVSPLGVFDHSMANPDFRAEGTKNKQGFRGYGRKGMRVYDFGWVASPRGWGKGEMGELRLQMHSTDPDLAAWRLGSAQSEGCVRIPATLNAFIDRHGVLDEDYERAIASGSRLWVLRKDRTPVASAGRYLVVVDSKRDDRPAWSPLPSKR